MNMFWEHVERYRFACARAAGKRVLDIACGEGYGSAALSRAGARSLVGVDIAAQAVEHARQRYGIDARIGDAESIPVADKSIDLLVSFETIEHVPNPAAFLDEALRVLDENGMLVISTPNLNVYRHGLDHNPFHCSEMPVEEFEKLLRERFGHVELYGQSLPVPRWMEVRGLRRFCRIAGNFFNPERTFAAAERYGSGVVELCLTRTSRLGSFFVLNTVRRMPPAQLKKCCYVVAVASQPRRA